MGRMPQVTAREIVVFLTAEGFIEDRQSGSHLTLWNEERKISVTVPEPVPLNLEPENIPLDIVYQDSSIICFP